MDETNWVDCLAEGTHQAMSGVWVTFTKADLDAIAAGYNPANREAPLVFGHPKTDDPAFGWATRWQVAYDENRKLHVLQGKFKQVPQETKDLVEQGRYAYVSMSFMPDKKTIRHVGLLGAAQPASAGNRRVSFSADDQAIEIEFASNADADPQKKRRNDMKTVEQLQAELTAEQQKNASLTEANAKLQTDLSAANAKAATAETNLTAFQDTQRKKSIEDRIDKAIADGKLLPAAKPEKLMVALALSKDAEEIELAAGTGKKSKLEIYLAALEDSPKLGVVGHEFAAPDKDKDRDAKQVDLTKHV